MADVPAEKSLDDFFAKRDKKKKKGKEPAVVPASAATKKTKKEKEKSAKNENQDTQVEKDDEEWKEFELKEVDYTGLRLQALQMSDEREEEEYEKEEVGEDGEIILVSGDKVSGPWNKSGAPPPAAAAAPDVEEVEAPEAKPSGVYRPPGARDLQRHPVPLAVGLGEARGDAQRQRNGEDVRGGEAPEPRPGGDHGRLRAAPAARQPVRHPGRQVEAPPSRSAHGRKLPLAVWAAVLTEMLPPLPLPGHHTKKKYTTPRQRHASHTHPVSRTEGLQRKGQEKGGVFITYPNIRHCSECRRPLWAVVRAAVVWRSFCPDFNAL
uniref:Protein CDV3 homolog n=1 Tax=Oryzias sinensis TaxID=183150 RepID=A0A8C7XT66_9TELE